MAEGNDKIDKEKPSPVNFIRKEVIELVKTLYYSFPFLFILFNSLFFLLWLFGTIVFQIKESSFIYILAAALLITLTLEEHKGEKIAKNRELTNKLSRQISFFGSIVILFVFLISFLDSSSLLAQYFFELWYEIEFAINVFFLFVLVVIPLCILLLLLTSFLLREIFSAMKMRGHDTFRGYVFLLTFLGEMTLMIYIMATPSIVADVTRPSSFQISASRFVIFVFNKIKWITGFSLVFLHSGYLISKITNIVKKKKFLKRLNPF